MLSLSTGPQSSVPKMPIPTPAPKPAANPVRKPRTLPIPRSALSALDSARECPQSQLETHYRILKPHFSDATALEYIFKRLHNGLTTSRARLNYATLLCAILRTKKSAELLNTPYPPHTMPRQEALARVTLIAAMLRAGLRDSAMVPMLRTIACAENGRWRLGDACVTLVVPLLPKADYSNLRDWCRQRRFFGDGLYLACVLLREGILSDDAFTKIYQSQENVRKALMEATDTGFSMISYDDITRPPVWLEALSAKHELLGLSVWDTLQIRSSGIEKKLLTVALLPEVARHVTVESFDKAFTSHVGKVTKALCAMHEHRGVRIRLDRVTQSAKRAVKNVLDRIGQDIWKQLSKVTREVDEAEELCTRFLLWSIRNGVVHRLFPKLDVLSSMEECLAVKLFNATVREYAMTRETGMRNSLLRFLFVLSTKRDFSEEAVSIVTLYAAFEDGRSSKVNLKRFESSEEDTFAGCLPIPSPPLSQSDVGVAFRRLVEFSAERKLGWKSTKVLHEALEAGMTPRCASRIEANNDLKDAIFRVIEAISQKSKHAEEPLLDSLRTCAEFVVIQYFTPVENPEAEQKAVADIRDLVESLHSCVSVVLGVTENSTDEEPTPVEKVAHLIASLCGHESASFRQISVKAVEALRDRLDDEVMAVLFDAMDSYIVGSGVADAEGSMSDEDEEGGDSDEGENDSAKDDEAADDDSRDGGEVQPDNDDAKEGDMESDDDDEGRESAQFEVKQTEKDESEDDSEPEIDEETNGEEGNQEAKSEDDGEDSGPDVDMDVDDEDPEVLAQFDERLSMHLKLINKEKKIAKQRKLRSQFRFTQVSRVLTLIESVAKILRMRIETAKEIDQRPLIIFLDLHARLYEFALSDEAENGRFLAQVTGIVSKQMMMAPSFFAGKVTDKETVAEIAKRFLEAVQHCNLARKLSDEETRSISKSAGCLVGTSAALAGGEYGKFYPILEDLVRQALSPEIHFVRPKMLTSLFRRAPAEAAKLLAVVEETLKADEVTKNCRTTGSEIIAELAEAAREGLDVEKGNKTKDKFWNRLAKFFKKSITTETVKNFRPIALANFVQAASHGIRGRCFTNAEDVADGLSEVVKIATLSRKERVRLLKLLRISTERQSTKRKSLKDIGDAKGEKEQMETQAEERRKSLRPRKRLKKTE